MDKFYKTLGVSPGSSKDELKRAYRQLATQHHPDKGGDPERFKEISKAYDILTGKRQLTRHERAEQERETQSRHQQVYQEQYRPQPRYTPPPPRQREYVQTEYDRYDRCKECSGQGKLVELCVFCDGTGNRVYGKNGSTVVERCVKCKSSGKKILHICEHCGGKGSTYVGKVKSGYWR